MLDPVSLIPEFEEVQRRMEAAFRRLSGIGSGRAQFCSPVYEPPTDVLEMADCYVVLMEIAGIAGEQVELQAEGETVTIRGTRYDRREPLADGSRILQLEVSYGPFGRTLQLPSPVDAANATARYLDGFLQVRLPKLPVRRQYLLTISVA
jgi:HSP20 family protein